MLTVAERQQRFKNKMYAAGLKQIQLWVKRKPRRRNITMNRKIFAQKLKKLTSGMSEEQLSELFNLLLQIIEAQKEVSRIINRT